MPLSTHETAQGWIVAYSTGWNDWTGRPRGNERWLSVDEARERYESGQGVFEVTEASERDDEVITHARWVFGITGRSMVRAQFFNPAGSILTSITYTEHDGRLFVNQRADYAYADATIATTDPHRPEPTQIVSSTFKVDGRGWFTVRDKTTGESRRTAFKDADFSTLWFDWPAFGDWDTFADPEHGILPHDFTMTPL